MPKTRLTDAAVKKYTAPEKGKRREVQDSEVPQLWLRITERGHKSGTAASGKQYYLSTSGRAGALHYNAYGNRTI